MNLDDIRRSVERETQYAPDLNVHRLDVREVIDRTYQALGAEKSWSWLVRRSPLFAFPDLTIPHANVVQTAGFGPRTLTLGYNFAGNMFPAKDDDAEVANILRTYLSGAEFGLADPTLRDQGGASTWELGPFAIEMAHPGSPTVVQLDPRCNITAIAGTEGDYLIRFPRARMPADLGTIRAVRDSKGRPLEALTPAEERRFLDGQQAPGTPRWVLEDHGHDLRIPPTVHPLLSTDVTPVNANQSPYLYGRENWPLRETPVLAEGGGGSIPQGTRVKVIACWWQSGRFGPPSEPSNEITMGAGTGQANVTGLPVLPTGGANIEYGRRVAVFASMNDSAYYLRGFVGTPVSTFSFTTTNDAAGLASAALRLARFDEVYPGGHYKHLRLWPRPAAFERMEVEYVARPRKLIEPTDEPEFEPTYHPLLIWLTCIELSGRFPDSQFYKRAVVLANEQFRRYNNRYLTGDQYPVQSGMVGQGGRDWRFVDADHLNYTGP